MSASNVSGEPGSAAAGSSRWDRATSSAGSWTRAQFEDLPLVERVRLLATGELRFFSAGQEVSARNAFE